VVVFTDIPHDKVCGGCTWIVKKADVADVMDVADVGTQMR
jgi:hypothetical protein